MESKHRQRKQRQMRRKDRYHEKSKKGGLRSIGKRRDLTVGYGKLSDRSLTTRQKRRFTMLPQDHTVMVRQTSRWGQIFLLSLVGVGVTAITTAWVYRIDEVVTVSGWLIPPKGWG